MDFKAFQRDDHHWDIYIINPYGGKTFRRFKIRGEPGNIFLMDKEVDKSINFRTVVAAMAYVCDNIMGA